MKDKFDNNRAMYQLCQDFGLTVQEAADAIGCTKKNTELYLYCLRRVPDYRLRLFQLEIGAVRPAFTPKRLARKRLAKLTGETNDK